PPLRGGDRRDRRHRGPARAGRPRRPAHALPGREPRPPGGVMLLAVDVGNTHTVLGLFEGEVRRADWRIPTRRDTTVDELGVLFRALFRDAGLEGLHLQGMIVSSVVPGLNETLSRTGRAVFGLTPLMVEPGIKTGMPILYDNPAEVGADRIVTALAAKTRYGA